MESKTQTQILKDLKNRKIRINREFDAPVELVWKAWTQSELLDQWWAPRPFAAKTKSMQFKEGGSWLYTMIGPDGKGITGPDGKSIWSLVEFTEINRLKSFQATHSFSDENGTKNPEFHDSHWKNVFHDMGPETLVEVEISFDREADMEKLIAMGFEAGFTAALGNLDELLAK
jgi:uncharacterized protein YndB with AHSA1/START domain